MRNWGVNVRAGTCLARVGRAVALVAASVATTARAQTVRGVVVDRGDKPVPGVVVQLVDSSATVIARALSTEQGEFRFAAPHSGTYRLHTLRIGYRPATGEPFVVATGEESSRRIVLAGVALSLDTVRVSDRSSCRLNADTAAAIFAMWEQVRSALTAAQLTSKGNAIDATVVSYQRVLDAGTRRVMQQGSTVTTGLVTQPWAALPPDELRRRGYVIGDGMDTTTFFAPGLDALLDQSFVIDHCFRMAGGPDPSRIGIEFEPASSRRRIADIRGTLWLDRATSELRAMDFRYVNVSNVTPAGRAIERLSGGGMEFAPLRNGNWVITHWDIRMPILAPVSRQQRSSASRLSAIQIDDQRVIALKIAGGELSVAIAATDTLFARPPLLLRGVVSDSVTGTPITAAQVSVLGTLLDAETDAAGSFTIKGMLPGEYVLEVRTPSLDSASAVHQSPLVFSDSGATLSIRVPNASQLIAALCRAGGAKLEQPGVVFGSVSSRDSVPPRNVRVIVEWTDAAAGKQARWLDARTSAQGAFRACGVPLGVPLMVRAESDAATSTPSEVRIPPNGRFVRADMTLDRLRAVAAASVFTGTVSDSLERPIAGADISIPELGLSAQTNDRGRFRIADISPGEHRILVRRVGYGAADAKIEFPSNQTVDKRVILSRFVLLDSVIVTGATRDIRMEEFEENRKLGLGHFLTRADLAKAEGRTLSGVVEQLSGVKMIQGQGNGTWVASSRGPRSLRVICYDREGGSRDCPTTYCYAQVYLDNIPLYRGPGDNAPVPNLRQYAPEQIEAIEYYASPAQTPVKYQTLNSPCGVLVMHTRRWFGDSKDSVRSPSTTNRVESVSRAPARAGPRAAVFTGVVLDSTRHEPIVGVEIAFPDISLATTSNDRGEFRIENVPAGTHRMTARRIGYGFADTQLTFASGDFVNRRVVLSRFVTLDSVVVSTTIEDRRLREFEENRKFGMGHFWTREELEKLHFEKLEQPLDGVAGANVRRGATHAWVRSNRQTSTVRKEVFTPNTADRMRGAGAACYAHVYVDNVPRFIARPEEDLFDLNSISVFDIVAMEYYSNRAQTPGKYLTPNAVCGVLVIWTRRG
jgi:hypothetical protein